MSRRWQFVGDKSYLQIGPTRRPIIFFVGWHVGPICNLSPINRPVWTARNECVNTLTAGSIISVWMLRFWLQRRHDNRARQKKNICENDPNNISHHYTVNRFRSTWTVSKINGFIRTILYCWHLFWRACVSLLSVFAACFSRALDLWPGMCEMTAWVTHKMNAD